VLAGEGAELLTLVRLTDAAGEASTQRRPQFLEQTMPGRGTHSSAQATRTTLSSPISGTIGEVWPQAAYASCRMQPAMTFPPRAGLLAAEELEAATR
jgi:hypothetical protein